MQEEETEEEEERKESIREEEELFERDSSPVELFTNPTPPILFTAARSALLQPASTVLIVRHQKQPIYFW